VFENDEGAGDEPRRAFSPYGLSKGLTFQVFRYYCQEAGLPLGKFVIPNPFGPFEEPRFTAFLMKNWKAGKPVEVKTPDYVRDNIHVGLLAAAYAKFAGRVAAAKEPLIKINPSGYAEKQGEFAQRVGREVKSRLGWACELKLAKQVDFSEPLNRVNTEPAAQLVPEWNESKAWDAFAEFYAQ
jgi:nucleoside-diphosphate-sugar epimerase